jgi:hypothetical protein
MTTQRELTLHFVMGQGATRASNMRWVRGEEGGRRYLLGGYEGREVVICEWEPLNIVHLNYGFPPFVEMHHNDVRQQQRRVARGLRQIDSLDDAPSIQIDESSTSPPELPYQDVPTTPYEEGGTEYTI